MLFNLSEPLALAEDTEDAKVPREYKMLLSTVNQSLAVLSEDPSGTERIDQPTGWEVKM